MSLGKSLTDIEKKEMLVLFCNCSDGGGGQTVCSYVCKDEDEVYLQMKILLQRPMAEKLFCIGKIKVLTIKETQAFIDEMEIKEKKKNELEEQKKDELEFERLKKKLNK